MQKILTNSLPALIGSLAVVYLLTCPETVMPLDSAEMTWRAHSLGVMHPPGYPLQSVFNAFMVRALSFLRPLTAVTVGNILIALAAMTGACLLARRLSGGKGLAVAFSLGVAPLFWSYATTPEVFIGLQLFAIGFCWLLFSPEDYRRPGFIVFLSMSMLHHHTVVFLAPWVLRAAWMNRSQGLAHVITVIAGLLSLGGYGALMLFNPEELQSWGFITDWSAVINHFLRKEYGTFALATSTSGPPWNERIEFALTVICQNAFLPLVILLNSFLQKGHTWTSEQKILGCTVLVYVLTFTLSGTVPFSLAGMEVYRRFFLLPVVLLYVLSFSLVGKTSAREWRPIFIILVCSYLVGGYYIIRESTSGMREISEQFHRDLLTTLPTDSVVLMRGDTLLFTTSYLQSVEGVRKDVAIVPPSLLPWEGVKLKKSYPNRFLGDPSAPTLLGRISPGLSYNEATFIFRFSPGQVVERQEMSFRVSAGNSSLSFSCDPSGPVYRGPEYPLDEYSIYGGQVLNYGLCDFTKAIYLLREARYIPAERSLEEAIRKSPYNPFYQERLCHVLKETQKDFSDCNRRLDILLEHTDPEYLKNFRTALVPTDVKVIWNEGDND